MKKNKINKLSPKVEVHYSVRNRKHFKAKMWLITLGLLLILLGCAACFTFGTVTWDPDKGFEPGPSVQHPWQAGLIVVGAVISVAAIVGYFLICFYTFKGFYATQAEYWKSPDFKKAKAHACDMDLFKLNKKDLKWYKKMGYINADQLKVIMEEQKIWIKQLKEKKQKINYAKSKA